MHAAGRRCPDRPAESYQPRRGQLRELPMAPGIFKETSMQPEAKSVTLTVFYRTLNVEGLKIFYREAGPRDAPTVSVVFSYVPQSDSHACR